MTTLEHHMLELLIKIYNSPVHTRKKDSRNLLEVCCLKFTLNTELRLNPCLCVNLSLVSPSPTLCWTGPPSRCISGSSCSGSCVGRGTQTLWTVQRASSTWSPPRTSPRSETWSSWTPSRSAPAGGGCVPAVSRAGWSGSLCSPDLAFCRGSWWETDDAVINPINSQKGKKKQTLSQITCSCESKQ